MIQNSFIHFPGIGVKRERLFWKEGILSWGDFINKTTHLQSKLDKNNLLIDLFCLKLLIIKFS